MADQYRIPLVEADRVLRPQAKSGILDRSVFHDGVHPKLRLYSRLGTAAVESINESHEMVANRPEIWQNSDSAYPVEQVHPAISTALN